MRLSVFWASRNSPFRGTKLSSQDQASFDGGDLHVVDDGSAARHGDVVEEQDAILGSSCDRADTLIACAVGQGLSSILCCPFPP